MRSTIRDDEENFYEANRLDGDVDMYAAMRELVLQQHKRHHAGPFRPDHGHPMRDDLGKNWLFGYRKITGLAEFRRLELAIQRNLSEMK
ncbi:MAG TPA: mannonate dehydratase [Ohtaekwangia sp.]|nr:mannonate dehydratase [Ohtaekwangia sp.]